MIFAGISDVVKNRSILDSVTTLVSAEMHKNVDAISPKQIGPVLGAYAAPRGAFNHDNYPDSY